MLNRFPWAPLRIAVLFAASPLLVAACGGSVEISSAPGGKSGAANGGAANGGAANGGAANGGSVSGGSGGACPSNCPAYLCAMGFKAVREPGACCPTCEPDGSGGSAGEDNCALVDCQAPVCGAGFKYQRTSGQCCGSCVPDNDAACKQGRSKYYDLQDALLSEPSAMECKIDSDCVALGDHPLCGDQCTSLPVNVRVAQLIMQQLSQFEAAHCSTCKAVYAPCEPIEPPTCAAGRCVPFFE